MAHYSDRVCWIIARFISMDRCVYVWIERDKEKAALIVARYDNALDLGRCALSVHPCLDFFIHISAHVAILSLSHTHTRCVYLHFCLWMPLFIYVFFSLIFFLFKFFSLSLSIISDGFITTYIQLCDVCIFFSCFQLNWNYLLLRVITVIGCLA